MRSSVKKTLYHSEDLERRAEELLAQQTPFHAVSQDIRTLVHDLQVYQIELSLQNEELTKTQCQLVEVRDLYCDLYNHAPVAYLTLNQRKIRQANLMAATMLGLSQPELVGKDITAFILPPDQDIFYFHVLEMERAPHERHHCELRMMRPGGRVFDVCLESLCHRAGTEPEYRIAIIDITEKNRMEEELKEARDRAEAANHAKSEFLANMSHEIRTPLNVVIGLNNILLMKKHTPEQQDNFLQTMQESANNLLQLINDMLDIAKIEAGKMELDKRLFNLHLLVKKTCRMAAVEAEKKGLNLTMDYPEKAPKKFIGDSLKVGQVLTNLLNNAIKFTESGSVTLSVQLGEADKGAIPVSFRIVDTGIGIPQDKLEHIFGTFTQQDASTTRKYGGTGLGLSLCRKFARLMHGDITTESTVGEGSAFTFTCRLHVAPSGKVQATGRQRVLDLSIASTAEHHTLLIVEDYEPNILMISMLLEEFGYDYAVAKNSRAALELFEKEHFSTILMDVQMQGMDGLEITCRIRDMEKKYGRKRTPIIAMTAHALTGDREKCLNAGMDDYISKPVHVPELKEKILFYAGGLAAKSREAMEA